MKLVLGLAAVAAAFSAAPAEASDGPYHVTLTGTVTSEVGSDPGPISVGDALTLNATFDADHLFQWGDTGYPNCVPRRNLHRFF